MICHLCQTETVDTVTSLATSFRCQCGRTHGVRFHELGTLEWERNEYTVIGEVATLVDQMAVPPDPASVINLTGDQASFLRGDR